MVIAHQGRCDGSPPNSVAGLAACVGNGIRHVEVDLCVIDGHLVLAHDALAPLDKTVPISALESLAAEFDLLMLDVKHTAAAAVAGRWAGCLGLRQAVFATTSPGDFASIRRELPDARLSLSFPADRPSIARRPALGSLVACYLAAQRRVLPLRLRWWQLRYHPDQYTVYRGVATRGGIAAAHKLGRPFHVWTVDDADEALSWHAAGADAIITNRPLAVMRRLAEDKTAV